MRRIAVAMALSCSLIARAEPCARPKDASPHGVSALTDQERLTFLSKLLAEESERARNWLLVWGATYGVMGVAQLAVMPAFSREEQPDWYWGAASTAVGVAFILLDPPEVLEAGPLYAAKAARVTPEGTCALIAEGERMLAAGAEHEVGSMRWYIHGANVLFNVALGLVLGLGYGHWQGAAINTGVGVAIGEANILSAPAHLISGWKRYRDGEAPAAVTFQLVPAPGVGLGMLVRF